MFSPLPLHITNYSSFALSPPLLPYLSLLSSSSLSFSLCVICYDSRIYTFFLSFSIFPCTLSGSPTRRPTESPTFKPTQSPTISMAPTQTESPTISLSPTEFVSSSPVRSRVQATNSGQNNLKSSLLSLLLAIPISAAICLY